MDNTIAQARVLVTADTTEVDKALTKLNRNLTSMVPGGTAASKVTERLTGGLLQLVQGVSASAFRAISDGIGSIAQKGMETAKTLDTTKAALKTTLKAGEDYDKLMKSLKAESVKTPFDLTDLTSATQKLTMVSETGAEAERLVLNVGKALAAAGRDSAELTTVTKTLQQIGTNAKITSRQISVFGNAGIDIARLVSEYSKLDEKMKDLEEKDVKDYLESISNPFDVITAAFNAAGEEGGKFAKIYENMGDTIGQVTENMNDAIGIFGATVMEVSGYLDKYKEGARALTEAFMDEDFVGTVSAAIRHIIEDLDLRGFIESIAASIKKVAAAINAGQFDNFKVFFKELFNTLKNAPQLTFASNLLKRIIDLFSSNHSAEEVQRLAREIGNLINTILGIKMVMKSVDYINSFRMAVENAGKAMKYISGDLFSFLPSLDRVALGLGRMAKTAGISMKSFAGTVVGWWEKATDGIGRANAKMSVKFYDLIHGTLDSAKTTFKVPKLRDIIDTDELLKPVKLSSKTINIRELLGLSKRDLAKAFRDGEVEVSNLSRKTLNKLIDSGTATVSSDASGKIVAKFADGFLDAYQKKMPLFEKISVKMLNVFHSIGDGMSSAFDWMKRVTTAGLNGIVDLWDKFSFRIEYMAKYAAGKMKSAFANFKDSSLVNWVKDLVVRIQVEFSIIADKVKTFTADTANRLANWTSEAFSSIKSFAMRASITLRSWVDGAVTNIKAFVNGGINILSNWASSAYSAVKTFVLRAGIAIRSWVSTAIENLKTFAVNAWTNIRNAFSSMLSTIQTFATNAIAWIKSIDMATVLSVGKWVLLGAAIAGVAVVIVKLVKSGQLQKWFSSIVGGVKQAVDGIGKFAKNLVTAGKNFIIGFWNGFVSGAKAVFDGVVNFFKELVAGVKHVLGIHSPSTVMRDEVGIPIDQGIAEGIRKGYPAIASASKEVLEQLVSLQADWVDELQDFGALDLVQTANAFRSFSSLYIQGSRARLEMDDKIHSAETAINKEIINLVEKYNEEYDKAYDTAKHYYGMFDYTQNTLTRTTASVITGLQRQNNNLQKYYENLSKVATLGLDKDFIQELMDQGMDAAAEVNGLANATEDEIDRINELWRTRGALASDIAALNTKTLKEETLEEVSYLQSGLDSQIMNVYDTGTKLVTEFSRGIYDTMPTLEDAIARVNAMSSKKNDEGEYQDLSDTLGELAKSTENYTASMEELGLETFKVGGIFNTLKEIWSSLPGWAKIATGAVAGVVGAGIVKKFWNGIKWFFTTASRATTKLGDLVTNTVLKSGEDLLDGATEASDAVGKVGDKIKDKISKTSKDASDKVKDTVDKVGKDAADKVSKASDKVTNTVSKKGGSLISRILDRLSNLNKSLANWVKSIGNLVSQFFKSMWQVITEFFKGVWNSIVQGVKGLGSVIKTAITEAFGIAKTAAVGAIDLIKVALSSLVDLVGTIGPKIIDVIEKIAVKLVEFAETVGTKIIDMIAKVGPKIVNAVMKIGESVAVGLGKIFEDILKYIGKGFSALLKPLSDPSLLIGATVILELSGALLVFADACKVLNDVKWDSLGKAGAIVGAVTVIAGIFAIPGVAEFLLAGEIAVAGLGAAMAALGWGIGEMAKGISGAGEGLERLSNLKIDKTNLLNFFIAWAEVGAYFTATMPLNVLSVFGELVAIVDAKVLAKLVDEVQVVAVKLGELNAVLAATGIVNGDQITEKLSNMQRVLEKIKDIFSWNPLEGLADHLRSWSADALAELVTHVSTISTNFKQVVDATNGISLNANDEESVAGKMEQILHMVTRLKETFEAWPHGIVGDWLRGKDAEAISGLVTKVNDIVTPLLDIKERLDPIDTQSMGNLVTKIEQLGQIVGSMREAMDFPMKKTKNASEAASYITEIASSIDTTIGTIQSMMNKLKELSDQGYTPGSVRTKTSQIVDIVREIAVGMDNVSKEAKITSSDKLTAEYISQMSGDMENTIGMVASMCWKLNELKQHLGLDASQVKEKVREFSKIVMEFTKFGLDEDGKRMTWTTVTKDLNNANNLHQLSVYVEDTIGQVASMCWKLHELKSYAGLDVQGVKDSVEDFRDIVWELTKINFWQDEGWFKGEAGKAGFLQQLAHNVEQSLGEVASMCWKLKDLNDNAGMSANDVVKKVEEVKLIVWKLTEVNFWQSEDYFSGEAGKVSKLKELATNINGTLNETAKIVESLKGFNDKYKEKDLTKVLEEVNVVIAKLTGATYKDQKYEGIVVDQDLSSDVSTRLGNVYTAVKTLADIGNVLKDIPAVAEQITHAGEIIAFIKEKMAEIPGAVEEYEDDMLSQGEAMAQSFINGWNNLKDVAKTAAQGIQTEMWWGIQEKFPDEYEQGVWLAKQLINGINSVRDAAEKAGAALQGGFHKGIEDKFEDEYLQGQALSSWVIDGIWSKQGDWWWTGDNVVAGFAGGMKRSLGLVSDASWALSDTAIKQLRKILRIESPSKVMAELGEYVTEGFAEGITSDMSGIEEAGERIAESLMDGYNNMIEPLNAPSVEAHAIADKYDAPKYGSRGASIDNRGITVNQTNNVYDGTDMTTIVNDLAWAIAHA